MTPTGIALIVGFVVILIIALGIDNNTNKKFMKKINEEYPVKESMRDGFVTEKGEFLLNYCSGSLRGYKKWNLQEIGYIATYRGNFSLHDRNGQVMKGEYLTPSKKKLLVAKAIGTFEVGYKAKDDYIAFLKKHAPHIQHMVGGKVVD